MRMSLEDIFLSLTTEETAAPTAAGAADGGGRCVTSLAIARKELQAYFASPIAYV